MLFDHFMFMEDDEGMYGKKNLDRWDPVAYENWKNFFMIWASIAVGI